MEQWAPIRLWIMNTAEEKCEGRIRKIGESCSGWLAASPYVPVICWYFAESCAAAVETPTSAAEVDWDVRLCGEKADTASMSSQLPGQSEPHNAI